MGTMHSGEMGTLKFSGFQSVILKAGGEETGNSPPQKMTVAVTVLNVGLRIGKRPEKNN